MIVKRSPQIRRGDVNDRIRRWRNNAVRPLLRGKVLDVGCGDNELLANWPDGWGVGVDVYPWSGVDVIVDSLQLPFCAGSFDTVCCVAALNHIPQRSEALDEMRRALKPGGTLLITMINPLVGLVCHRLLPGEESHVRGMAAGELYGMWSWTVVAVVGGSGFSLEGTKRFGLLGLNTLYVFRKS